MVRLRREIEGVRRNSAVPEPSYALDRRGTTWALPQLDRLLSDCSDSRVLLAGSLRRDLAQALAGRGNWVTVADLDDDRMAQWHAQLPADIAGRLTLVARPYGEMAFAPASFDRIALFDTLTRYRQPQWVLHKAQRELKPEALLFVREVVAAPMAMPHQLPSTRTRALAATLAVVERLAHSAAATLVFDERALEAIDRGAHLHHRPLPLDQPQLLALIAEVLTVDRTIVGHPLRLQAAQLAFGARAQVAEFLSHIGRQLPQADTSEVPGPRAVAVVARRALKGGILFS